MAVSGSSGDCPQLQSGCNENTVSSGNSRNMFNSLSQALLALVDERLMNRQTSRHTIENFRHSQMSRPDRIAVPETTLSSQGLLAESQRGQP